MVRDADLDDAAASLLLAILAVGQELLRQRQQLAEPVQHHLFAGHTWCAELQPVGKRMHANWHLRSSTAMKGKHGGGLAFSSSVQAGEPIQRKPRTPSALLSMSPSMAGKLLFAQK